MKWKISFGPTNGQFTSAPLPLQAISTRGILEFEVPELRKDRSLATLPYFVTWGKLTIHPADLLYMSF